MQHFISFEPKQASRALATVIRILSFSILLSIVTCPTLSALALTAPMMQEEKGRLVFSTSVACRVFLDGEEIAQLAANDVKKVSVGLGEHILVAKNDHDEVIWKKVVSVKSSSQVAINIEVGGSKPKGASGVEGSKAESSLLIKTERACKVSLDGNPLADLTPGGSHKATVLPGSHIITALTPKGARWEKTVEIKISGLKIVQVEFPRFEDRGDGTVVDTKTGLMWTKKNSDFDLDLDQARGHAEKLVLGGYKDWRLPTIIELETLLGTREKGGQKASSVFDLTANCAQWSTTKDDSGLLLMCDRGSRTGYPAEARGNTRALYVRQILE